MNEILIWFGIAFCISQSAIFSGLNLAFFSLTRLRLEIEAETSSSNKAKKVLSMRKDSNFLLTTILWGNVGINVLLTLLSDSIMAGVFSFAFSTIIITFFGEIIPQAYFSRNALKMASLLSPVLKFYQFILYPVAKPCALLLDSWLGKESIQFFSENNIKLFINKHIEGFGNEIEHYCHIPIIVTDENTDMGILIKKLRDQTDIHSDIPIEKDVIIFWSNNKKRIITGADIFGRLLKGI